MLWLSYRYFLQLYQIDTEFHRDHHNSILNDMKRLCANYGIKMLSVHEVLNQHVLIKLRVGSIIKFHQAITKDHSVYILRLNQIDAHARG